MRRRKIVLALLGKGIVVEPENVVVEPQDGSFSVRGVPEGSRPTEVEVAAITDRQAGRGYQDERISQFLDSRATNVAAALINSIIDELPPGGSAKVLQRASRLLNTKFESS